MTTCIRRLLQQEKGGCRRTSGRSKFLMCAQSGQWQIRNFRNYGPWEFEKAQLA